VVDLEFGALAAAAVVADFEHGMVAAAASDFAVAADIAEQLDLVARPEVAVLVEVFGLAVVADTALGPVAALGFAAAAVVEPESPSVAERTQVVVVRHKLAFAYEASEAKAAGFDLGLEHHSVVHRQARRLFLAAAVQEQLDTSKQHVEDSEDVQSIVPVAGHLVLEVPLSIEHQVEYQEAYNLVVPFVYPVAVAVAAVVYQVAFALALADHLVPFQIVGAVPNDVLQHTRSLVPSPLYQSPDRQLLAH
jgi:hypothetical protein